MDTDNVRITAYVKPRERTQLRVLAAKRGVKVTVLVREAISEYLARELGEK
jgi:hypothetical protein